MSDTDCFGYLYYNGMRSKRETWRIQMKANNFLSTFLSDTVLMDETALGMLCDVVSHWWQQLCIW